MTNLPSNPLPGRLALVLRLILAVSVLLELYERQWLHALIVASILLLTAFPAVLARGAKIELPPQFELWAIAFIFASLFLGERRDFYHRIWWWDLALHSTAGALLGILGFLLVYVLNESPRIDLKMRPAFVAFFAFCFSLAAGSLWEIFEFSMDRLVGTTMQKPTLDDPSGLTDTMWDLIVNAIGALVLVVYCYRLSKRKMPSAVERWIREFIARNPRLFHRRRRHL
ncbi:MAG: hypothetical protein U1D30_12780 [Planctomycetota bacterium]